jgi:hypothetical protein
LQPRCVALVVIYAGLYNIAADVPHMRPVYWLLETVGERSVTARARDIIVHWRISLFRAEQTMLAEIVLAAPETPRRNIFVQELDKDHRPCSHAWIRDTTSYAFEDDEAFCRQTGSPI